MTTRVVGQRGQEVALEPTVVESIVEVLQGEILERLTALDNPICVGPIANGEILFVDGYKEMDELLELERNNPPHEDHEDIRTRVHADGLRILTPQEVRIVERTTGRNFIDPHAEVSSNLENDKEVFWTHPFHSFQTGHFIVGSSSGSHITLNQNCRSTWTRRGFSVCVDSNGSSTKCAPSCDSKAISELLDEYDRRFLKNPIIRNKTTDGQGVQWHMDWPSTEQFRASLGRDAERISEMSAPFIQSINLGQVLALNQTQIWRLKDEEAPPENMRWTMGDWIIRPVGHRLEPSLSMQELIFPGEWRFHKN